VESSCECGNEPSGSIKCWELPSGCTTCGLSSGTQLHTVSGSSGCAGDCDCGVVWKGNINFNSTYQQGDRRHIDAV
jgi:hypothetical protein